MRVRAFTIFVLTTILSFSVLASDSAKSGSKDGSPERADKAPTARKISTIRRDFGKPIGPQNLVSIGGSVKTSLGYGIPGAKVVLMDMDGNIQYSTSASFGFFVLPNVVAGEMYVLSVRHPRFIFAFPAQVIEIHKPAMDFVFIGERNF